MTSQFFTEKKYVLWQQQWAKYWVSFGLLHKSSTHCKALLICQDLRIWIAHQYLCQVPFQGPETELLLIVDKKIVGCKVYMTHQAISYFSLDSHVPVCVYQIDLSDRNLRSMEDFLIMPIPYSPRFNMQLIFSAVLQYEWQCCK